MIRSFIILLFGLVSLLFLAPDAAQAQSKEETEQRLRVLQDQITLDVVKISETEELEQASLKALEDLEREIAVRENLIDTNQRLLAQIEQSRDSLASSLGELEEELDYHRQQYQKRAIHAYKYGRLHDVALILAARSINQMLIRIRYLNQFSEQRESRLGQILASTSAIRDRRTQIDENAAQAQELIQQASGEQSNLKQLRTQRNQMVNQLKQQRGALQTDLEEKQLEAQRLETLIRQIISNEGNRRANVPTNPVTDAANAEISSAFFANKGTLPWPAEGAVIEAFGTIINPVYSTQSYNPGILISTTPSAAVSAVFQGEVNAVYTMPEFGRVITISHGEYTSLYGNLSVMYGQAGARVEPGQLIGRAGTESEPKGNAVFFAIFQNGSEVNPTTWLRPN
ncbi:MAG: peptidoglycan DD-metalloendopeptidase family protein [Rhodothermaceae bacterium]|nr:peptidoglycan DD-metalloendopeptidase family protein [Rhodothermaceae bacterium]